MSLYPIRPLRPEDFPDWLPLWDGNNDGKRRENITTETWARLIDPDVDVHGLGAFQDDVMLGLVHYVVHPVTGSIEPVCYMQDLYVDPKHRQKGVARALVKALSEIGKKENWNRMYWLAETNNIAAQNLYKNLGVKLNFTLHVWPIAMLKK